MAAHPLFPTGRLMPLSGPGGCCHLLTTSREQKTDNHQGSNTPKTHSNNSSQQRLKTLLLRMTSNNPRFLSSRGGLEVNIITHSGAGYRSQTQPMNKSFIQFLLRSTYWKSHLISIRSRQRGGEQREPSSSLEDMFCSQELKEGVRNQNLISAKS